MMKKPVAACCKVLHIIAVIGANALGIVPIGTEFARATLLPFGY